MLAGNEVEIVWEIVILLCLLQCQLQCVAECTRLAADLAVWDSIPVNSEFTSYPHPTSTPLPLPLAEASALCPFHSQVSQLHFHSRADSRAGEKKENVRNTGAEKYVSIEQ